MKQLIFLVLGSFFYSSIHAQVKKPVNWEYSIIKLSSDTYEVKITAFLDAGWHIYSQSTPKGGPTPTKFIFTKNPLLNIQGAVTEIGKKETIYEELFGVDVIQFSNSVVFTQKVQVRGKVNTALMGNVEFMACNDSECLPTTKQQFNIPLK